MDFMNAWKLKTQLLAFFSCRLLLWSTILNDFRHLVNSSLNSSPYSTTWLSPLIPPNYLQCYIGIITIYYTSIDHYTGCPLSKYFEVFFPEFKMHFLSVSDNFIVNLFLLIFCCTGAANWKYCYVVYEFFYLQ